MKLDCSITIKSIKGEPMKLDKETELKLGDVLAEALLSDLSGGKHKLFILASKVAENKETEVDGADLALIKKAVESSKSYGAQNILIMGQAIGLLEGVK